MAIVGSALLCMRRWPVVVESFGVSAGGSTFFPELAPALCDEEDCPPDLLLVKLRTRLRLGASVCGVAIVMRYALSILSCEEEKRAKKDEVEGLESVAGID